LSDSEIKLQPYFCNCQLLVKVARRNLTNLGLGDTGTIVEVVNHELTPRLIEMGFFPGKQVRTLFKAPFGGPVAFDLLGSIVSLRIDEAKLIIIEK